MGIVNCSGVDTQNAEVFYRVVQPGYQQRVMMLDKDIRMSLFFMLLDSTILTLLQKNMIKQKKKNRGISSD